MAYAELERVPETSRDFFEGDASLVGPQNVLTALRRHVGLVAVLLLVAIVTRGLWIGDPLVGGDEQFYLLVGDRLWQGAVPYVDIWDRKPIGLFLIYAALRPFSSDGVVAYQIGALVFATATAFVIARIASRLVPLHVAAMAGCLYLVWLPVLGGVGGQSPVFYNLFMATAALLIVKAGEAPDTRRPLRLAATAMLLVGLAMQIKYTAIVEGISFGLWIVTSRWIAGRRVPGLCGDAAILIGAALLPTVAAATVYIAIGQGGAFVFANFLSIFLKHTPTSETVNIAHNAVLVAPLLVAAATAFVLAIWRRTLSPLKIFLAFWSGAAIAGFFVVGHYYTHYALPMLVPLCIVCALMLETVAWFALIATSAIVLYVGTTGFPGRERMISDHAKADRMVQILAPYTRYGCIYINEGPTILYLLTHSCLPTSHVFPEHLTLAAEAGAFDTEKAMAEVIARQPPAIVRRRAPEAELRNVATDRMLAQALATHYRLKATIPAPKPRDVLEIFGRNDLP